MRYDLASPLSVRDVIGVPPDFLIEGVLARGTTVLVTGVPGAGKSPFAQDLAVRVAMGAPWHGHAVKAGKVVYVAAQSPGQTVRNVAHFACGVIEEASGASLGSTAFEGGLAEISDNIRIFTNQLTLEADTSALIMSIRKSLMSAEVLAEQSPALLVLDSLDTLSSASLFSDVDLRVFEDCLATIHSRWPQCVIMLLHRAQKGHPERSFGSHRITDWSDTIFSLTMLPLNAGTECDTALLRSVFSEPDSEGWRYTSLRLVMARNTSWETLLPVTVTMAVRGSTVRMSYGGSNPLIDASARTVLGLSGTDQLPRYRRHYGGRNGRNPAAIWSQQR